MKFKFTPQTCVIVAGLVTSAYATCYYQQTSGTCFNASDQVDTLAGSWHSTPGTAIPIYATSDWTSPNSVVTTANGQQAYSNHTGSAPSYCSGGGKYTDPSSHSQSMTYWENELESGNSLFAVPSTPKSGGFWGTTSGSTCS